MEEREILRKVEAIVCTGENVKPEWMHLSTRGRHYLSLPRQLTMALARQVYELPYACIGGFYNRNHETAISAEKAVQDWCQYDKDFKAKYDNYVTLVSKDMPGLVNIDVVFILQNGIKTDISDIKSRQDEIEILINKLGINLK